MPEAEQPRPAQGSEPRADWAAALEGPAGERLRRALERMPLRVLGRYPSPKRGGLPFGPELSILTHAVRRQSVQLYASGLSGAYVALSRPEHRRLYRAFTLGAAMPEHEWEAILGSDQVRFWRDARFLVETRTEFRAAFRVVVFEELRLLTDAFASEDRFRNRVHVGKDTVELLDHVPRATRPGGRFLDVGTGSGALLFALGRGFSEAVGVDVNPRAVAVARFNAALNGVRAEIIERDVFAAKSLGRFDRVTWNLPFHFFPTAERAQNLDGDGGDMGIELTLRFVDLLPDLLTEAGSAYLLTSSPTLVDGTELLVQSLADRAPRLGLDVRVSLLHGLWSPSRRRFQAEHGIRRIDNVVVEIHRGRGRVRRIGARPVQRAVDWVQGLRYGREAP